MRKKNTFFLWLALLPLMDAAAQVLRKPVTAAYTALGAYSNSHADLFSFASNQASLARISRTGMGVYGERRFLLEELSFYQAVFALPTKMANIGLKGTYYGSAAYNETQLGFAAARALGSKLDIGIQFNYNALAVSGYGNASAVTVEAGMIWHLSKQLHTGFHLNNPVGGKFGKDRQEKLPAVYTMGIGYEVSEKFFAGTEISKEEDQPVTINTGIQYKLLNKVVLRAGIASATASCWLGTGIFLHDFRIDVTASYHPQLGISPGLLLLFNFKNKTE